MSPAPLISIVIATRNAARDLPHCLDSIRAQTFRDVEVLVGDGASTDGTIDILKAAGDVVTYWQSAPDTGPYDARNRVLPRARGDWVCFLGADDWFLDARALERLAPQLRTAAPRYRVVYSKLRQIDPEGRVIAEAGRPWEESRASFRSYCCLPHPGLMHHRSLFEEHGLFDDGFKMAGDYELLLRELKTRDALFVPALTVGMGFRGQTTSPEYFYSLLAETESALKRHGLRPPPVRWAYWKFTAWVYVKLHAALGDRRSRWLADAYRVLTLRKPRYSGPK
jgi:glycosyltransferase involved in cell wall biosynthesis